MLAGDLLLRLIDIADRGGNPTLREAYELSSGHLNRVGRSRDDEARDALAIHFRNRRSQAPYLAAWRSHGRVAHLWAAVIYSEAADQSDLMRTSLPDFVQLAGRFAGRGSKIVINYKNRAPAPACDQRTSWRLKLPKNWTYATAADIAVASSA
jgi:hypothetical protein